MIAAISERLLKHELISAWLFTQPRILLVQTRKARAEVQE
jgi:hypothetical protein